jgi:Domain of unknown function (DUF4397)
MHLRSVLRSTAALCGVAAVTMAISPIGASAAPDPGDVRIHLIHGIPGVPVDVAAGGAEVFADFQFGQTKDLSALAGTTLEDLQVLAAGTDTVAIDAGDVDLPSSGNYTVLAHLTADGDPTLTVFENSTATIAAGQGRLVVRHTAAAPAVDITANGAVAFADVTNPNEATADLPVGTITAAVVPAGETEPVVIGPADLTIADGSELIVYAVGSLEDGTLDVLTETITGLGSNPSRIDTGNSPIDNGRGDSHRGTLLAFAAAAAVIAAGGLVFSRLRRVRS